MTYPPTYPTDYNQQLYAYLQALRQLLEPLTALTAAMLYPPAPGGSPQLPLMPTLPAYPPPVPGDYAQQLFGYLQGWRQYLEQMTDIQSVPQPPVPPDEHGHAFEASQRRKPVPPDRPDGSRTPHPSEAPAPAPYPTSYSAPTSLYAGRSTTSIRPPDDVLAPATEASTQVPDDLIAASPRLTRGTLSQPAVVARGPRLPVPPIGENATVGVPPSIATRRPIGAPTVASGVQIQPTPGSKYVGLANRARPDIAGG